MKQRRYTFERGPALRNIERILGLLKTARMTEQEIADALHISRPGLAPYIRHLRERRLIYISGWTREPIAGQRTFPRAMFRAGTRTDAPKPPPLTDAEIASRYRQRVMDDPAKYQRGFRKLRANAAKQQLRRRKERLHDLAAAGFDPHVISLTGQRVVVGTHRRTPTPEQLAEIVRLRDSGMYWKDIEKRTGVPKSTARTHYARVSE